MVRDDMNSYQCRQTELVIVGQLPTNDSQRCGLQWTGVA